MILWTGNRIITRPDMELLLPVVSHKSFLDCRQVLELLCNPRVPDGLLDPPVDPLVPLVVGEGHVLEEVVLLGGGVAAVPVAAPVLPDPFKEKYKGENKADNAQDNLGILFELNFHFLILGLSLETTEQRESY